MVWVVSHEGGLLGIPGIYSNRKNDSHNEVFRRYRGGRAFVLGSDHIEGCPKHGRRWGTPKIRGRILGDKQQSCLKKSLQN